jgi:hypothetical protein
MISVRKVVDRPQVLSTDRHVMQGYLDLSQVIWQEEADVLSGVSRIVGGDPYRVTLALNGYGAVAVECQPAGVKAKLVPAGDGLAELIMENPANTSVRWSVAFRSPP